MNIHKGLDKAHPQRLSRNNLVFGVAICVALNIILFSTVYSVEQKLIQKQVANVSSLVRELRLFSTIDGHRTNDSLNSVYQSQLKESEVKSVQPQRNNVENLNEGEELARSIKRALHLHDGEVSVGISYIGSRAYESFNSGLNKQHNLFDIFAHFTEDTIQNFPARDQVQFIDKETGWSKNTRQNTHSVVMLDKLQFQCVECHKSFRFRDPTRFDYLPTKLGGVAGLMQIDLEADLIEARDLVSWLHLFLGILVFLQLIGFIYFLRAFKKVERSDYSQGVGQHLFFDFVHSSSKKGQTINVSAKVDRDDSFRERNDTMQLVASQNTQEFRAKKISNKYRWQIDKKEIDAFESLLVDSPMPALLSYNNQVIAVNDSAVKFFRAPSPFQFNKRNIRDFLNTEDRFQASNTDVSESIKDEGLKTEESEVEQTNNQNRPVELTDIDIGGFASRFDNKVVPVKYRVSDFLVGDREIKRYFILEDKLQKNEPVDAKNMVEFFKKVMSKHNIPFGLATAEGEILFQNAALDKLSQVKAGEYCNFREFYAPWTREEIEKTVVPEVSENGYWEGELEFRSRSGKVYHTYQYFFVLARIEDKVLVGDLVVDITPFKRLEKENAQLKISAERAEKSLTMFFESVTNEYRSPLNAILGYVQLLKSDLKLLSSQGFMNEDILEDKHIELTGEQLPTDKSTLSNIENIIEKIIRSSRALNIIFQNLIDIASLKSEDFQLIEIDYDLRLLLEDTKSIAESSISFKGKVLNWKVDNDIPNYVYGDPNRLIQVLINLISASLKTNNTAQIDVRYFWDDIKKDAGELLVYFGGTLSDCKVSEVKALISDMKALDDKKHTGINDLGLVLGVEVVKKIGGTIYMNAHRTACSEYILKLPLLKTASAHRVPSSFEKLRLANHQKMPKTLVIGDDIINCDLIKISLERQGLSNTTHCDYSDAIEFTKRVLPSVICLHIDREVDAYVTLVQSLNSLFKKSNTKGDTEVTGLITPLILAMVSQLDSSAVQKLELSGVHKCFAMPSELLRISEEVQRSFNLSVVPDSDNISETKLSIKKILQTTFSQLSPNVQTELAEALVLGDLSTLRRIKARFYEVDAEGGKVFEDLVDNYRLAELRECLSILKGADNT